MRCGGSAVHLSIGWALRAMNIDLSELDVCELSARGPFVEFLLRHCRSVATSEYFADAVPGEVRNGIRAEDVQRLSYEDASFDLVTHTEVFEHVPDDAKAFAELHRVVKPGGEMVFTVPLTNSATTVARARLRDAAIEYVLPAAFHVDPLRGGAEILVYRDYGADIVDRLRAAGFDDVRVMNVSKNVPWNMGRRVVAARRLR